MGKGYFSKQAKCDRKGYAPCSVAKEQLAALLEEKAEEIVAFAKELLGSSYPAHFEMPKLLLLPVHKTQSFGQYAYNMVLQEEEKLAQVSGAEQKALQAKLKLMQANVKVERLVRGSFFADGGIVIYYCNVCQLCEEDALDFTSYIISVLAHEIFHALHFACCDATQGWKQMNYWNGLGFEYAKLSTVREALAEYFRYLWLEKHQEQALVDIMFKELVEPYAVAPSYPYAGVKCLLTREAPDQEKFSSVLQASLVNWHKAYEMLIS